MSASVGFEHRGSLGLIVLARPERINALNLDMLEGIEGKLKEWSEDPSVAVVFICGEGDRGFCAGGDVRTICEKLTSEGPAYGEKAFSAEYRIDFLIHTFPKPVVVWGHGAIMGAGLGLYVACDTRLLTLDASLAMPEVTIGLFPDVGASHFLSRLRKDIGLFMALVALRLSAADAIEVGLADFLVREEDREALLVNLENLPKGVSTRVVKDLCGAFKNEVGRGKLLSRTDQISELLSSKNCYEQLAGLSTFSDSWWSDAGRNFCQASPTSIKVTKEAFRRGATSSLADCFRQDLTLIAQCMRRHDFVEGVRARLIDRDDRPVWKPGNLEDISEKFVLEHFDPPWRGEHPLANLK